MYNIAGHVASQVASYVLSIRDRPEVYYALKIAYIMLFGIASILFL